MTEEVTEKKQQDKAVTEQLTVVERKSKTGLWVAIIIILIILLAGAGFYLLQQLKDEQAKQNGQLSKGDLRAIELSKQITTTQSQIAAMQSQLATFGADVTGTDDVFNKKLAEFAKTHNEKLTATKAELSRKILQLKRQLGKTRGDWLMADADYLLSVANQRLYLTGDIKTAIEALNAADQRLHESGDAAAFKVREQITKEKAALKAVTKNDIVASYATLQLLIGKIDKLALILPYAGKPLTASKEIHSHSKKSTNSHSILDTALKQVEGYVTIRHNDKPVEKILTPIQAQLIRQQLSIKLEMVKIALVQQNTALYKATIADAIKWLEDNFVQNELAKEFMAKFNALNAQQIHTELPDISLSLKMLRDISKLRLETDKALEKDNKFKNSVSINPTINNQPEKIKEVKKETTKIPATESKIKDTTEKTIKAEEKKVTETPLTNETKKITAVNSSTPTTTDAAVTLETPTNSPVATETAPKQ